ncbi:MAG TPA: SGNH family hydrolase [Xanthobacteraceae bacterium]|nr:SGNH family hydrolase [Xanthobacteraceae bacterium]
MARRNLRRLVIALAIAAGMATPCLPAAAQTYFWARPGYQPPPSQNYFSFPFFNGERYSRPPPAVDYSKAPPPRKSETPPTANVVVIGDSMADWLGYGLDEVYADQPEFGVIRQTRAPAGLIRYDAKNEALDWPQLVKDALAAEQPSAIIVMLGVNDRLPIRDSAASRAAAQQNDAASKPPEQSAKNPPADKAAAAPDVAAAAKASGAGKEPARQAAGASYEFHTDQWADLYAKRIDDMIAAVKSKGVPVLWVGLPALRGPKSTSDMAYLDELYRERAERAGIYYVDIWDGFVDDQGRYAVDGPDFEGQIRRLRTADGVHFSKAGAVKLASYVDQDLRRVMSSHALPVALPIETAPAAKPGVARPDVGPVLPLTASGGEGGDLVGAGGHAAPAASDPLAARVLSRGDSIPPLRGRADDFSWPRPAADNAEVAPVAPQPAALSPAPAAAPKQGAADEANKPADAKKDDKKKPAADSGAPKLRPSPRAELDGASVPRPPKPVGGGF